MQSASEVPVKPRRRVGRAILRPLLRGFLLGRRAVRNSEVAVMAIAPVIGAVVGLITAALHQLISLLHEWAFALPPNTHLSAEVHTSSVRVIFVPLVGAFLLGIARRFSPRDGAHAIVDPIEANALYGGRMSIRDSARLVLSTLTSNGSGASVGMEGGYTQMGSAMFAAGGALLRLRREDQRIYVTAGAAAAIAAAFNAPLAGAFYGFEVVQGSYTVRSLAPVASAALVAAAIPRAFGLANSLISNIAVPTGIPGWLYAASILLGLIAALTGIVTMRTAGLVEEIFRRSGTPTWLRPLGGAIILGILATGSPQVLGSGQGAIQFHLEAHWALSALLVLLLAKILASALSLGAGFRGGLFSSSLFIGCVLGAAFAALLLDVWPSLAPHETTIKLMGMAAVGASIIGAPLTMAFLVLEASSDFELALAVLGGAIIASMITRIRFGYSFATWRFHLRGLPLRGGYDIGWVRDLNVARLMRRDPYLVSRNATLTALQKMIPPGLVARVFTTDENGRYMGAIDVALLHDPQIAVAGDAIIAADLATGKDNYLTPDEDIRAALGHFDSEREEVLPVVNPTLGYTVVGYLTENECLRRYTQELERHGSEDLGMPIVPDTPIR
jgi:CIC family chloride channel protein